jgi:tRNA-modifying protein YgfZ
MAEHGLERDTLVVRGPERKTWLDGLLTCKVPDVSPGHAGYGLLLTKQGKIVTDAFLVDDGAALFVGVAAGHGAAVRDLLDRYLVMEDAELSVAEPPVAWRLLTGGVTPAGSAGHGLLTLGSLEAQLIATTHPGQAQDAAPLLAQHGLGVFGVDFGERDNPHEASLDRVAVSWTKGCYLGQEVVCMQDMRGKVKRRLVALEGGEGLLAAGATAVLSGDGTVAGQVSSVHPTPGGALVLASISTAALESQSTLTARGEALRPLAKIELGFDAS